MSVTGGVSCWSQSNFRCHLSFFHHVTYKTFICPWSELKCRFHDAYAAHSCVWSAPAVRGLLSCQLQPLRWVFPTALRAPLCHLECASAALLRLSPRLWAQRFLVMMHMEWKRPPAVTHANWIVCRVDHSEQPAICLLWGLFSGSHFVVVVVMMPHVWPRHSSR